MDEAMGYVPSPGPAMDEDDEWGWVSTAWCRVQIESVQGLGPISDLHRGSRF